MVLWMVVFVAHARTIEDIEVRIEQGEKDIQAIKQRNRQIDARSADKRRN